MTENLQDLPRPLRLPILDFGVGKPDCLFSACLPNSSACLGGAAKPTFGLDGRPSILDEEAETEEGSEYTGGRPLLIVVNAPSTTVVRFLADALPDAEGAFRAPNSLARRSGLDEEWSDIALLALSPFPFAITRLPMDVETAEIVREAADCTFEARFSA